MGIRDVRSYLSQKTEKQLIEEIIDLIKIFPEVKEHYQARTSPADEAEILSKYKKIIQNQILPPQGFGKLDLPTIRKAVNQYKRVAVSFEGLVELLLHFVEQGSECVGQYGGIKDNFYGAMVAAFRDACQLVEINEAQKVWKDRFREIVWKASVAGYGCGADIQDLFDAFFGEKARKR